MGRTVLGDVSLDTLTPGRSFARPSKRGLSPGLHPSPYLPSKRRLLDDEGVWSPELSCKSRIRTPVTAGRRLDFGGPENVDLSSGKATEPSHTRPIASTERKVISRAVPSSSDPQSRHFPGFEVYKDTHVALPQRARSPLPEPDRAAIQLLDKENIPVAMRRPTRALSDKTVVGGGDWSSSASTPRGKTPFTPTSLTPQGTPESVALSMLARGTPNATRRLLIGELDGVAELEEPCEMPL